ncbi:MAG TPA: alpha-amylase family glycosyl hydrolase [Polyangiaceae bacterium]|nr:alpha-amylase family glycosyl hydrolase [Polyangiaceae bacterium]
MTADLPARESAPWWQNEVIYQIYPRSFQDADGDGVGDLAGATARLDYLAALGVGAVWVSPFYPSPMADFGYDISDHKGVDPLFGTLDGFDAFVARARALGLKILLDYVPNHTSDQHPWFVEARASRSSPRRDFYVWADPKPDGSPPNNWLSVFGGPAWEWDAATGQYYLHTFLKEQPDLNWRDPRVKEAMFDVLRFWLDRGVDGFRLDAVLFAMKDPLWRDNPPNPSPAGGLHKPLGRYDTQLHVYDRGHPDLHALFREMRAFVDGHDRGRHRVLVGEMHVYDWKAWASYYGEGLDELHLPFNFGLLKTPWRAEAVRELVEGVEGALPPGAFPNYVLGNHDEPRIATRVGAARARVAMMLLLTLRGTPTLYYGDELGLADVPIPPGRERDPWGLREPGLGLGRDPARTPMRWDGSPNAGFCPAGAEPWLPVGDDFREVNVEAQERDPRSMLALTRALLRLRRASGALRAGAYRGVEGAPDGCFVYERRLGAERYLVALNFSSEARELAVPGGARLVFSTGLDREGDAPAAFALRGDEGCVFRLG